MSYSVGTDTRLTNKNTINPTNWVNGETPLDAANMNSLTAAILSLKDEIYGGGGPSTVDSIIDKLYKLREVPSVLGIDRHTVEELGAEGNVIAKLYALEHRMDQGWYEAVAQLLRSNEFISIIKTNFNNLDDGRAGIDTNKKTDYFEEIE